MQEKFIIANYNNRKIQWFEKVGKYLSKDKTPKTVRRGTNHKKKVMNLKWMSLFTYKGINNYLVIF